MAWKQEKQAHAAIYKDHTCQKRPTQLCVEVLVLEAVQNII